MGKTKLWAAAIVAICGFFGALGQLFIKLGTDKITSDINSIWFNWQISLGLAIYLFATAIFILVIKHGEISVLYPLVATSYVWVSLLSARYLGESMTHLKWAGNAFIILGVALIGHSTRRGTIRKAIKARVSSALNKNNKKKRGGKKK